MQRFDFHNPTKLIFGHGTIARIGKEIRRDGAAKVLMIAGGGSIRRNGVYEAVAHSLDAAGIERVEAWGVRANPVLSKVRGMIATARAEGVDAVLGVGGGSVVDSAKAVAAGLFADDVWALFENRVPLTEALPIYTVLTLSATGSEMNQYAVLSNEAEKKKWNIFGPALHPRVSVLDPSVQMGLPWHQTVNGALDALSHIMEFYFMGGRSETTLAVDEGLSRAIIASTDRLMDNPDDYESRASLAWAATLALNGISGAGQGTGDWATHGIEHAVSAVSPEVAHGAGLGVIFPAWIEHCHAAEPWIFERWARNVWGAGDVLAGVAAMRAKIEEWGGATTLGELGIDAGQIDEIADNAVAFGITGAVKELDRADICDILQSALG
jgi:alcohol dehydrogenase YqhD (iron-dependent ADH family)